MNNKFWSEKEKLAIKKARQILDEYGYKPKQTGDWYPGRTKQNRLKTSTGKTSKTQGAKK